MRHYNSIYQSLNLVITEIILKRDLSVIAYILCQNRSLLKRHDIKFYYR